MVFETATENPLAVWCRARSPRARSYSTVTIWHRQPVMPYFLSRIPAIARWSSFAAPALSSAPNQAAQSLPVRAFTAASLVEGTCGFLALGIA
jgi:hypothetical protein